MDPASLRRWPPDRGLSAVLPQRGRWPRRRFLALAVWRDHPPLPPGHRGSLPV